MQKVGVSIIVCNTSLKTWFQCDSSTQSTLNTTLNRACKIHALPHRDWSDLDVSEGLSGVHIALNQVRDEGAFSNLGRANHCHYYGRRLQRRPVHHRQVELFGLHVQRAPN